MRLFLPLLFAPDEMLFRCHSLTGQDRIMIERGFPIKRFCNCGPGLRHSLMDGWSLGSFAQASYTMRNFVVSADFLTTAL